MNRVLVALILNAFLWFEGQGADPGDCDIETTREAGAHLYYFDKPNRTFTVEDEIYMRRCNEQLDSADILLCYANRCLKNNGLEFFRKIVRAPQYEVLHLCHPHADPAKRKAFKALADCHNTIFPDLHSCRQEMSWDLAAVVKGSRVDFERFCCTVYKDFHCLKVASEKCAVEGRAYMEEEEKLYFGDGMQMLCNGTRYYGDTSKCDRLPPVVKTGTEPRPIFDHFINIAKAL